MGGGNMPRVHGQFVAGCLIIALVARHAYAQRAPEVGPSRGSSYAEIRDWHKRMLSMSGLSLEQRIETHRELIRKSPYGQQGLQNRFKNFQGRWAFDPAIPGIGENLRLVASQNYSQQKGAARTHLYATRLQHDPNFK